MKKLRIITGLVFLVAAVVFFLYKAVYEICKNPPKIQDLGGAALVLIVVFVFYKIICWLLKPLNQKQP